MIKKLLIGLLSAATALSVFAGTVNLTWDASTDPAVNTYKVYAVAGTNTVFTANNANATSVITITNGVVGSVSNLFTGAWSFTARAISTNGLESANAPTIWTNVPPSTILNFRFLSVTP